MVTSFLCLWVFGVGYGHPTHLDSGHLIIGKLVRLRRTLAEVKSVHKEPLDKYLVTTEETKDAIVSESKGKDDLPLSSLENKILLLMIVPPDKMKQTRQTDVLPSGKLKKKRKLLSGNVSKSMGPSNKCESTLAKDLGITDHFASQLMNNSSMTLLAVATGMRNTTALVGKLADALNGKIGFIGDVKPKMLCDGCNAALSHSQKAKLTSTTTDESDSSETAELSESDDSTAVATEHVYSHRKSITNEFHNTPTTTRKAPTKTTVSWTSKKRNRSERSTSSPRHETKSSAINKSD